MHFHEVEFGAGTHIENAVKQLVDAAAKHESVSGKFNDIELVADAETKPETLLAHWERETTGRAEAYRNSPEGKKAALDQDRRRSNAQHTHDTLMRKLPTLDMHNDVAVLDWLCGIQGPSDHTGVIVRRETIIATLEKAGFVAGANCGKDYKKGDRENMFRYLVGQALSGLKSGPSIHPILHKFVNEWKQEFHLCC